MSGLRAQRKDFSSPWSLGLVTVAVTGTAGSDVLALPEKVTDFDLYLTARAIAAPLMALADQTLTWPDSIALLGLLFFLMFPIARGLAAWIEFRKTKVAAPQTEAVRQLVTRYEQLAENTLDARQRIATDLAELRSRTTAIEQILRTVE